MNTDYSVAQKTIHWVMAAILMLDLVVAQKFGNPMELADRLESRVDHGSLGTIVLLLFILRIYLRVKHGGVTWPADMPEWQHRLAKVTHLLFYILIGVLLCTGIATAMNATDAIALFGLFDITIGRTDSSVFDLVRKFHEFATNALIALIALHIVAALFHGLIKKDGLTGRMLRFWASASRAR